MMADNLKYVLDASAVIAILNGEERAEEIYSFIPFATILTINLTEVLSKLVRAGVPYENIITAVDELALHETVFDSNLARKAGFLTLDNRFKSLSLGDRACLSLAANLGAKAITTDKAWSLAIPDIDIHLIP